MYPWKHREEGAPLPPPVTLLQVGEEQGIRTSPHNPWRSRQKTQKLRMRKAAIPMQNKGPTKRTDKRRKRKTEVRRQGIDPSWGLINPRPQPNRRLF